MKTFGNVLVRGVKYGMFNHHRGKGYCYGFVHGRVPCQIQHLIEISLSSGETKSVALVRRFGALDEEEEALQEAARTLPWHDWFDIFFHRGMLLIHFFSRVELGISLWACGLERLEAVAIDELSGRFAWGEILITEPQAAATLTVVFSLDHVCLLICRPYFSLNLL